MTRGQCQECRGITEAHGDCCVRCQMLGAGDVSSGFRVPSLRFSGSQDDVLSVISQPQLTDMQKTEHVLALFGFNLQEIQ
jgi:hypothetical protein